MHICYHLTSPQKQQALAALNTQALTLTEAFKKQQMSAWLQKNQLQDVLQPAMLLNVLLGAQSENQVMDLRCWAVLRHPVTVLVT